MYSGVQLILALPPAQARSWAEISQPTHSMNHVRMLGKTNCPGLEKRSASISDGSFLQDCSEGGDITQISCMVALILESLCRLHCLSLLCEAWTSRVKYTCAYQHIYSVNMYCVYHMFQAFCWLCRFKNEERRFRIFLCSSRFQQSTIMNRVDCNICKNLVYDKESLGKKWGMGQFIFGK